MNHSHQNQQQQNLQNQQNQQQYPNQQQLSEQQLQSLLRSYLIQQQTMQQPPYQSSKTISLPMTPVPAMPISNIPVSQQQTGQSPLSPLSPVPSMPTMALPVTQLPSLPVIQDNQLLDDEVEPLPQRKRSFTKFFAIALIIGLAVAIYFIWQAAPTTLSASTTGIQNSTMNGASAGGNASSVGSMGNTGSTSGNIQVYVLGAVKTPGVYTLASTARVVDLIKAAGGPLPKANLVALNMAAKLTDGEEVYVTLLGETPPTYMGGVPSLNGGNSTPVAGGTATTGSTGGTGGTTTGTTTGTVTGQTININTASASDMMTNLHVSSRTAQAIIDYRTQNGNYTSVTQLLQVVSRSIYDKIRLNCTV